MHSGAEQRARSDLRLVVVERRIVKPRVAHRVHQYARERRCRFGGGVRKPSVRLARAAHETGRFKQFVQELARVVAHGRVRARRVKRENDLERRCRTRGFEPPQAARSDRPQQGAESIPAVASCRGCQKAWRGQNVRGANALQQRAHPRDRLEFPRHEFEKVVSRSLDSLGNGQLVAASVRALWSSESARAARGGVPAEHDEQERVLLLALARVGLGWDHGGIEACPQSDERLHFGQPLSHRELQRVGRVVARAFRQPSETLEHGNHGQ